MTMWIDSLSEWVFSKRKYQEVNNRINDRFKKIDEKEIDKIFSFTLPSDRIEHESKFRPSITDEQIEKLEELTKKLNEQEEVIYRERAYWRNTFNKIPDPIFIVDEDNNIKNCNEEFQKLVNMTEKQIIGKKCYDVVTGCCGLCTFCKRPDTKTSHIRLIKALDNEEKKYMFSSSLLTNENNYKTYIVMMFDVTKLNKAEKSLISKQHSIDGINLLGSILNKNYDRDHFQEQVLEVCMKILETDFACILKRNGKLNVYQYKSENEELSEQFLSRINNSDEFISLLGKDKYLNKDSLEEDYVINSDNFCVMQKDILFKLGFDSMLASPIILDSSLIGYICALNTLKNSDRSCWEPDEVMLLNTVSNILSLFLKENIENE